MTLDIVTQIGLQFGALGILGYVVYRSETRQYEVQKGIRDALNDLKIIISHCKHNNAPKRSK